MIRIRTTAALTLALVSAGALSADELDRSVLAMGTRLRVVLSGRDAATLAAASEAALSEVARIEAACSTWRAESSWSELNGAEGQVVRLDSEWILLLTAMKDWSARTEGAFDPALMPLVKAWNLRGAGRTPSAEDLAEALAASGVAHLRLDGPAELASFNHPAAGIEEGGFLKGYALDAARKKITASGPSSGLLDFGGQLLAMGRREVSLADPVDRQQPRFSLRLENASLSTSGTSERGRHILDPRTGQPVAAWGSVSVVSPSALDADVLSTALFVMGPKKGLAWATARHLPACFLTTHGRPRMTREFKALLLLKEFR